MTRPISAAYLERKLRAITGVQQSNPLPDLESMAGLVQLEVDRPEWGLPGGERLYAFGLQGIQAVGEFSYITIENPFNSGTLVVVERITAQVNSTAGATNPFAVHSQRDGPSLPVPAGQIGSINGASRDLRIGAGSVGSAVGSVAILRQGNDATPFAGQGLVIAHGIHLTGSSPSVYQDHLVLPWILGPGSRLWCVGLIVNTVIFVGFHWRERPLEGTLEVK